MLDRFYLIINDVDWLTRLLPLGLKLVQLRLKDVGADERRRQIGAALALCRAAGCTLVINDYWREAIEFGAEWVHLGQEDLGKADLNAIRSAGLKLGLSTHSPDELATALAADPDYVALGPVYPTTAKVMAWSAQGLEPIAEWRRVAGRPLVAVGGITLERAAGVFAAGADSIAVISDVLGNDDPEARCAAWLRATR